MVNYKVGKVKVSFCSCHQSPVTNHQSPITKKEGVPKGHPLFCNLPLMVDQLEKYIEEKKLCGSGDRLILAVSGGIDSVAMAHLFSTTKFTCALAHCNFQLRGEDSEADETFVRSLGESLEMMVYVNRFDVEEITQEKGISVQMAARELRYTWFEKLLTEESFDWVATAHNKNDSVESFFLNLSRGTGIRGLVGIPPTNGQIIRPLLFASRQDIIDYSNLNNLEFRLDASNVETKYRRNKIRHDVIPVMEQINQSFVETMSMNMSRLKEVHGIFKDLVETTRRELFKEESGRITIDIGKLSSLSPRRTWFYELFSPFGFTRSQCKGIENIMVAKSGKQSISVTHQLFKDREKLILIASTQKEFERYYLDGPENSSSLPFPMDMEIMDRSELQNIPTHRMIACIDFDKIQFPLTIRHWTHGDYFYPLGMDQIKKLSDFFVDTKIPVPEKERTWILASGKMIVWIMGHRIDHRFRITEETTKVLLLRFKPDIAPQHLKESI